MTDDLNIIWRKGDGEMPEKVKRIVNEAREERLIKSLHLSYEVINTIRYNASKGNLTVSDYISEIVREHITVAT